MRPVDGTQEYLYVDSLVCILRSSKRTPSRNLILAIYQCRTQDGKHREVECYLLIEHDGAPKEAARAWFHRRGHGMPSVARYGLRMAQRAKLPKAILVERDGKWDRVVDEYFDDDEVIRESQNI